MDPSAFRHIGPANAKATKDEHGMVAKTSKTGGDCDAHVAKMQEPFVAKKAQDEADKARYFRQYGAEARRDSLIVNVPGGARRDGKVQLEGHGQAPKPRQYNNLSGGTFDDDEFFPLGRRSTKPTPQIATDTKEPQKPSTKSAPQPPQAAKVKEPQQPQARTAMPQIKVTKHDGSQLETHPVTTHLPGYTVVNVLEMPNAKDRGMSLGVSVIKDKAGKQWVEKRLPMHPDTKKQRSDAERRALQQVGYATNGHKNVLRIRDAFWNSGAPVASLILEYCNGDSLADGIESMKKICGGIKDDFAVHILSGIANGLAMLHHGIADSSQPSRKIKDWNTICHLDLKPANVLLSHDTGVKFPRVVISGFGCCITRKDIEAGREETIACGLGTKGWSPPDTPELSQLAVGKYGKPSDVWQAGGVVQAICRLIDQPDLTLLSDPCGSDFSKQLNVVVASCLATDFRLRPTAIDLCNELRNLQAIRKDKV